MVSRVEAYGVSDRLQTVHTRTEERDEEEGEGSDWVERRELGATWFLYVSITA